MLPLSVRVPLPVLTRLAPLMEPEKVAAAVWFTVRVWPEAMTMLPPLAPPPLKEPIVSLVEILRTAPLAFASVTVPASARADPPLMDKVPALIVVPPV